MRKKTISVLLLSIVMPALWAQNPEREPDLDGRNEISINGLNTLLGSPEISYERFTAESNAWGLSVLFTPNEDLEVYSPLMLTPFYRVYFSRERQASGFFLEASLNFILGRQYTYQEYRGGVWIEPAYSDALVPQVGAGFGAGWKFVTEGGWTGTIFSGVTRNFAQDSYFDFYPRMGLSLGRRF